MRPVHSSSTKKMFVKDHAPQENHLGQINNYLSGWLPKLAAQATSIKGPYLAQKAWSDRRGQYQAKWLKHFQGQAIHPTAIHLITTCFTLYCGKYGSWGKVRSNLVCNCLPSHQVHETIWNLRLLMSLSHICSSLPPVAPHFCVFTEGLHWSHLGTSRRSCMIDAHNLHWSVHLRTSETYSWEGRYSPGLTLGFGRTCSVPLPTYRPFGNSSTYPKNRGQGVKFLHPKWIFSNSNRRGSQVSTGNWQSSTLRYVQSSALAPINTESALLQVSSNRQTQLRERDCSLVPEPCVFVAKCNVEHARMMLICKLKDTSIDPRKRGWRETFKNNKAHVSSTNEWVWKSGMVSTTFDKAINHSLQEKNPTTIPMFGSCVPCNKQLVVEAITFGFMISPNAAALINLPSACPKKRPSTLSCDVFIQSLRSFDVNWNKGQLCRE